MSEIAWTVQDRTRYHAIFSLLEDHFDEKTTRLLGAAMALSPGHGGQTLMHEVTGLAMDTLQLGVAQLQGETPLANDRIRRPGGGRKPVETLYPQIEEHLIALIDESTCGDPEAPLRWTTKSLDHLAHPLTDQGMPVSLKTIARLLTQQGYRLQSPRKRFEGGSNHPDRDHQFKFINAQVRDFQSRGQPVISVDAEKKRNSSATTKAEERNITPRAIRSRSWPTMFPTANWGKRRRMASMSPSATSAGSPWAPIMIRPSSPSPAFVSGGNAWDRRPIRGRRSS